MNIAMRENRYKVLHRGYLTPFQLLKMYPNGNRACWKCGCQNASFMHMWWECKKVKRFGQTVQMEMEESLQVTVPFTLQIFCYAALIMMDVSRIDTC